MSSSLLIVILVVLWLVVLAPMLLRNQGPVRRTSKALKETRVLFSGGSGSLASRLPRTRTNTGKADSSAELDEDEPTTYESEDDYRLLDEGDEPQRSRKSGQSSRTSSRRPANPSDETNSEDIELVEAELTPVSGEDLFDDEDKESTTSRKISHSDRSRFIVGKDYSSRGLEIVENIDDADVELEEIAQPADSQTFSDDAGEPAGSHPVTSEASKAGELGANAETNAAEEKPAAPVVDGEVVGNEDNDDETKKPSAREYFESDLGISLPDEDEYDDAVEMDRRSHPEAYLRPADVTAYRESDPAFAHAADYAGEPERAEEARAKTSAMIFDDGLDALSDDELAELAREESAGAETVTDEDREYVSRHRGRGVYDPELAQRNSQRRFARRKKLLIALSALFAVMLIASIVWGGAVWIGTIVSAIAVASYLYFLRKQAIEEQALAARRLRRMRRARMGVRNTADEELGVPQRLRRPAGTVVEVNDDDPDLVELDYVDAADYFRLETPSFERAEGDYNDEVAYGEGVYAEFDDEEYSEVVRRNESRTDHATVTRIRRVV